MLRLVFVVTASLSILVPPADANTVTCAGSVYQNPGAPVFCSKHFVGSGKCDGQDQLPIKSTPWEDRPIAIVGVSLGLVTHPPTKMAYAFAGNSYVHDIMALQIGAGSTTVMFPSGMSFPLPAAPHGQAFHVDTHVSCTPLLPDGKAYPSADRGAANYQIWMVVFYTIPNAAKSAPETLR